MRSLATDRHLFLVGFMATGKSTVGRLLAARLGRQLIDLDERIEAEAEASIAELFGTEGEAGFRARETQELARVLSEPAAVIAVGGGAVASGDNLEKMLTAGLVVGLSASPDEIIARIGDPASRPLLARVANRRAEVERLLALRTPYYARADVIIDTSGIAPSQVLQRILGELKL